MYIRKEMRMKSIDEKEEIKIGPDAVLFKYVEDPFDDYSLAVVEGEIYHVGLDFVEILQKDHRIVSVNPNRINYIKWPDKKTREPVFECKNHGHCRCIDMDWMRNLHDGKQRRPYRLPKHRGEFCMNCRQTSCKCQKDKGRRKDYKKSFTKFRSTDKLARVDFKYSQNQDARSHDSCPYCHERLISHEHLEYANDQGERRHSSQYSNHMRDHQCGHQKFTCFCDYPIPFCNHRFELRLAGLTDDVRFELLKHKGRQIEIILG